ncbi:hypothetical protein D1224_07805 [Henriciella barbarensis]|uniref:Uncharacterized protein n=1 Tax=Henriciella barbarensis TaxID=86342 RepID=A0A399R1P3_9PROT|nr:hypothetical protein [Henriciella barbarensis]RIJ24135.1 hypothetical protein D1224_07805 [Henriciella barbarensis]
MSTEPPQLDRTLQRLWQHLARLAASLLVMVEQSGPVTPSRWIRPSLLAAEALARRLLMLEVRALGPLLPLPESTSPSTRNARPANTALAPSRRGFQLTEPIASLRAGFWIEGQKKGRFGPRPQPRILEILDVHLPRAEPDNTVRSNKLAERLHALLAVIEDTAAATKRLARRMAPRIRKAGLIRKRSPLRAGHPPGARSAQVPDWLRDGLAVVTVELRAPPPLKS